MKFEIIQTLGNDVSKEDGGNAIVIRTEDFNTDNTNGEDKMFFLNIISWDEDRKHIDINKIINKKVKITIEIIE